MKVICEKPGDDLPKLIYADWLEETNAPENQDQLRFIRVMAEMLEHAEFTPRRLDLEREAKIFVNADRELVLPQT